MISLHIYDRMNVQPRNMCEFDRGDQAMPMDAAGGYSSWNVEYIINAVIIADKEVKRHV